MLRLDSTLSDEGSLKAFRELDPWHQCVCRVCDRVSKCEKPKSDMTLLLTFFLSYFFFSGAEWVGRGGTVMSASDTQAACMVPVSSHGSATARKAGAAFSATRVSSWAFPEHLSPKAESRQLFLAHTCYASLTNKQAFWLISLFFNLFFFKNLSQT